MLKQKVFSVFISSSFKDMHAERDFLKKYAFAQLEAELMKKGARLRVIDLRGSEKQDENNTMSAEEKVFYMCLEGVDTCRPRLIGLLGDRYGWVPYENDETVSRPVQSAVESLHENTLIPITKDEIRQRSITDLEILYGLKPLHEKGKFIEPHQFPHKDCFFYFREWRNREAVPKDFFDGQEQQNQLKDRIRLSMGQEWKDHCKEYKAGWNTENETIDANDLKELSTMLVDQLRSSIMEELENQNKEAVNPEFEMEAYLAAKESNTIKRAEADEMVKFALESTKDILLVTGVAGSGKSALFSQVHKMLSEEANKQKLMVISHIGGIDANGSTLIGMLEHLCNQIDRSIGLDRSDNESEHGEDFSGLSDVEKKHRNQKEILLERLSELITAATKEYRLIICIDSIDSLEKCHEITKLGFLPYTLPSLCKVLLTSLPNFIEIPERYAIEQLELLGMPEEDSKELFEEIATSQYGKGWNDSVLKNALAKFNDAGRLPLYAEIMIGHLMYISGDIYRTSRFQEKKEHEQWMLEEIEKMPCDIDKAYGILFARLREDYGAELVEALFGIIAVTRHGLFDGDLQSAIEVATGVSVDVYTLLSLRGRLRSHLRQNEEQGWWNFEHQQMRRVLINNDNAYFSQNVQQEYHRCLLKAFDGKTFITQGENVDEESLGNYRYSNFMCSEYVWHTFMADEAIKAHRWLSNLNKQFEDKSVKVFIDVLDCGESGIAWLERLFNMNEVNQNRCILFAYKHLTDASKYFIRHDYLGRVLRRINDYYSPRNVENPEQPEYIQVYGVTCIDLGRFYDGGGNRKEAEVWYKKAEELMKKLFERNPETSKHINNYGATCRDLGRFYDSGGNRNEADIWYKKAEELMKKSYENNPETLKYIQDYGVTCRDLGRFYDSGGNRKEAEVWHKKDEELSRQLFEKNPETLDYIKSYGVTCSDLGRFYDNGGNRTEAERWYKKQEELLRQFYEKNPETPEYIKRYGVACNDLGKFYDRGGNRKEAEVWYKKSEELLRQLYEKNPETPEYIREYGVICIDLGRFYDGGGNRTEAKVWYKKEEELLRQLYEKNPETPEYIKRYGISCNDLGKFYDREGNRTEAEVWYKKSEELLRKLYEKNPETPEYIKNYGAMCNDLGRFYESVVNRTEAEVWYKKSEELLSVLYEKNPETPEYIKSYGVMCNDLAKFYDRGEDRTEVEVWYKKAEELSRQLYEKNPETPEYIREYGVTCADIGRFYDRGANPTEAKVWYIKSEELLRKLYEKNPETPEYIRSYGVMCNDLGKFYDRGANRTEAEVWYKKDEWLTKKIYEKNPETLEYIKSYEVTCTDLGKFYDRGGNRTEAEVWYKKAEKLSRQLYEKYPDTPEYIRSYGVTCNDLGRFYESGVNREEAEGWYKKAEAIMKILHERNPETTDYINAYAVICSNLGDFMKAQGALNEALSYYEISCSLLKKLIDVFNDIQTQSHNKAMLKSAFECSMQLSKYDGIKKYGLALDQVLADSFEKDPTVNNLLEIGNHRIILGKMMNQYGEIEQGNQLFADGNQKIQQLAIFFANNGTELLKETEKKEIAFQYLINASQLFERCAINGFNIDSNRLNTYFALRNLEEEMNASDVNNNVRIELLQKLIELLESGTLPQHQYIDPEADLSRYRSRLHEINC